MTMKRLMLVCVMMLCLVVIVTFISSRRNARTSISASFDMETDGLVQVHTVHESNKPEKNYVLASEDRIMETEAFVPEDMQVYMVKSFSIGMDNMLAGPLKVYDEANQEIPVTREIDTICHAMQEVGHHVMECRILQVEDEWFVSAMLNVNLWTPFQFYYFNRESGKLMLLYTFDGRDVTAVRILSAEKLHVLDQNSIGGWYVSVTPSQLIDKQPDVLENVASMFLQRDDVFDDASIRGIHHDRKLAVDFSSGLTFSFLLHGASKSAVYMNEDEKKVFQSLLDICPPYEIEQLSGTPETCTVLIFRFSAFNPEKDCQEEWTFFRLSDAAENSTYEQTVSLLQEQHGELIPCNIPGWMMLPLNENSADM